jgi:hypothetical protein
MLVIWLLLVKTMQYLLLSFFSEDSVRHYHHCPLIPLSGVATKCFHPPFYFYNSSLLYVIIRVGKFYNLNISKICSDHSKASQRILFLRDQPIFYSAQTSYAYLFLYVKILLQREHRLLRVPH